MLNNIGGSEFFVLAIIGIFLFGSNRVNDAAKKIGEAKKELDKAKKEYETALKGEILNDSKDLEDIAADIDENNAKLQELDQDNNNG